MAARQHKLSKVDDNLAVLYQHILIGEEIYEYLREFQFEHHKHLDHKNNINWLLREIRQAICTSEDWIRGRQQLTDLRELETELRAYYDLIYGNNTIIESVRLFLNNHHRFHGIIKQLLRLFAD